MALSLSGSGEITGFDPTASGFGKVLQVVRVTDTTDRSTTSTTLVDVTGMSVTITPKISTSSIIVIATGWVQINGSTDNIRSVFQLANSSNVALSGASDGYQGSNNITGTGTREFNAYLNYVGYATPETTSAVTYKLRFRSVVATNTTFMVNSACAGQMYAIEVAA